MQTPDALIRKKDYISLLAISNRHNEGVARIMRRTSGFSGEESQSHPRRREEIAQTEEVRQSAALNQQVAYLADIRSHRAPMLRLLGTVIGIVQSFRVINIDAATPAHHAGAWHRRSAYRHGGRAAGRHPGDDGLCTSSAGGVQEHG